VIVSSQQIQVVLRLYGARQIKGPQEQRSPAEAQVVREEGADRAELSEEALFYQEARKAVQEAPDVREERVREIKEALVKGTYAVPAETVAEKMLGRLLVDRRI